MKQGTIRTLGAAAAGAAITMGTAGAASAASVEESAGQSIANIAANTQNMSVEDAVLDLPGNLTRGANTVQAALDLAQAEAEAGENRADAEAGQNQTRAVQAPEQQGQLGAVSQLLGGLPVLGDVAGGGLSTDGVQGDLVNGGLPVGDLGALR